MECDLDLCTNITLGSPKWNYKGPSNKIKNHKLSTLIGFFFSH
jgi:hypothetical protein